jgi:hypothetical protein
VNALLAALTVGNTPRDGARGPEVRKVTQPEGFAAAMAGLPALVRAAAVAGLAALVRAAAMAGLAALVRAAAACVPPHTARATATLAAAPASLNG